MPKQAGPHALVFIFVTVLIDTIGFGIILPVTPQLIMDLTGQGIGEASMAGGWLAFSYAIAQFLFGPVIGNLSDHFGRRQRHGHRHRRQRRADQTGAAECAA